jgi:hypothetical protein
VANIGFELLAAEKNNLIAMPTFGKDQPKNGRMKIFKLLQIWPGTLLSKTLTMKKTRKFPGKSLETLIRQKQNGEWKIAYLGFRCYPEQAAHK